MMERVAKETSQNRVAVLVRIRGGNTRSDEKEEENTVDEEGRSPNIYVPQGQPNKINVTNASENPHNQQHHQRETGSGASSAQQQFTFDGVVPNEASQLDVYATHVRDRVAAGLQRGACNVAVLAYGQTGSGKTHTIMGAPSAAAASSSCSSSSEAPDDLENKEGVIPRALRDVFEYKRTIDNGATASGEESETDEDGTDAMTDASKKQTDPQHSCCATCRVVRVCVSLSYLEIYNEKLVDLLNSSSSHSSTSSRCGSSSQRRCAGGNVRPPSSSTASSSSRGVRSCNAATSKESASRPSSAASSTQSDPFPMPASTDQRDKQNEEEEEEPFETADKQKPQQQQQRRTHSASSQRSTTSTTTPFPLPPRPHSSSKRSAALLGTAPLQPPLRIRMLPSSTSASTLGGITTNTGTRFVVQNLFKIECDSLEEATAWLAYGNAMRRMRSHNLNDSSSRSHTVLTVQVDRYTVPTSRDDLCDRHVSNELCFVDLAGSEKLTQIIPSSSSHSSSSSFATLAAAGSAGNSSSAATSTSKLVEESISINTSLLVLGKVISALSKSGSGSGSTTLVPYRESKLTLVLKHILGSGSACQTCMIACIHPHFVAESVNTLVYASRARFIRNASVAAADWCGKEGDDPKSNMIRRLKLEVQSLRMQLQLKQPQQQEKEGGRVDGTAVNAETNAKADDGDENGDDNSIEGVLSRNLITACRKLQTAIDMTNQFRNYYDALQLEKERIASERDVLCEENLRLREELLALRQERHEERGRQQPSMARNEKPVNVAFMTNEQTNTRGRVSSSSLSRTTAKERRIQSAASSTKTAWAQYTQTLNTEQIRALLFPRALQRAKQQQQQQSGAIAKPKKPSSSSSSSSSSLRPRSASAPRTQNQRTTKQHQAASTAASLTRRKAKDEEEGELAASSRLVACAAGESADSNRNSWRQYLL